MLIGAAVDVVVKGEQSFLARHVLGTVGITDTWQQLLVLGAINVFVWGGESLTQYLYEVKWRQLAQDIQPGPGDGNIEFKDFLARLKTTGRPSHSAGAIPNCAARPSGL